MLLGGEDSAARSPASPQPGGRRGAPGQLGLLQAFINTHFDLVEDFGSDVFATPAALRGWLVDQGLLPRGAPVTGADLERILVVRDGLRELIATRDLESGGAAGMNRALAGAALGLRFTDLGPELVAAGPSAIDRALAVLLAILVRAMTDGRWLRLKVCPGSHCGWVFYDHSRNNSGRWCSMRVCGGREKARAHYRRQRGH